MAKFNPAADLDNYASTGSFFSLKNDGDFRTVRFMYNDVSGLDGYGLHRVKVNGYDRNVDCLREYNDPLNKCPLCEARYKVFPKFFVNLYDDETQEQLIWERGQNFYSQFADLCQGCNPLVSYPVKIIRHGKKGDMETTYEFEVQEQDDFTLDDCPEPINPYDVSIIKASYDELLTFVQTGSLTTGDNNPINRQNDNTEVRRRRDVSSNGVRRNTSDGDVPL